MRDLSTQELDFVYGAGMSPMPASQGPKKNKRCKARKGSKSGTRNRGKGSNSGTRNRCGKGGSS